VLRDQRSSVWLTSALRDTTRFTISMAIGEAGMQQVQVLAEFVT